MSLPRGRTLIEGNGWDIGKLVKKWGFETDGIYDRLHKDYSLQKVKIFVSTDRG